MEFLISDLGPLHPAVVHFSVACPILAFFCLVAHRFSKKTWLIEAAAWLWVLTLLSALGSTVTGHLLSLHQGFEDKFEFFPPSSAVKGQLLEHVGWASSALAVALWAGWAAWAIFKKRPWPKAVLETLGLVLAVLFGITGHEGGEMIYGSQEQTTALTASPTSFPSNDPLDSVADYRQKLVKVNTQMWNSRTHGHRWVNTYVSADAVAAYKNGDPLPEGAQVVKESFQDQGGRPSTVEGPLYAMVKGPKGSSPQTGDWQYAFRWAHPVADNPEKLSLPVTWLPGDPSLSSCIKCHDHFRSEDYMGGVPPDVAAP